MQGWSLAIYPICKSIVQYVYVGYAQVCNCHTVAMSNIQLITKIISGYRVVLFNP